MRIHDRNRGYGANQKTCYREALSLGATVIVLLHPDYQYHPGAVPALVAPILAAPADFVFGSRFACTGDPRAGGMPGYRYYGNRAATIARTCSGAPTSPRCTAAGRHTHAGSWRASIRVLLRRLRL